MCRFGFGDLAMRILLVGSLDRVTQSGLSRHRWSVALPDGAFDAAVAPLEAGRYTRVRDWVWSLTDRSRSVRMSR